MEAVVGVMKDPNSNSHNNNSSGSDSGSSTTEYRREVQNLVDMLSKLNPLAKEFFPSAYYKNQKNTDHKQQPDGFFHNRRRRNSFNQGRRRQSGRGREDSVRRTVYVSDIHQQVTEEQLAALFTNCGQVVDCRICGDPHSVLRFAFVEFSDEHGARAALNLGGTMLGFYPVRVLPSKTAILPVNPTFLPRSEDEREMCARTVYCTNIDKKVTQADVKNFFESICGEVSRLRLLGDNVHSTRIAFVEFIFARLRLVAGKYMPGEVVAIRVPLLHLSNFQINDWPELSTKRYALMVLMLPSDSARQWHVHGLELVEVVADQVAVALSHAAILEESMRARDLLMEQNVALDHARREAEEAIRARNDFLAVMNHEMRTPMHAIIALSSLLQETELTPEQRLMIETILKSSNLLATLINDVLDLSRLEEGSLQLDIATFNLHSVFREVQNLIKPIASVKKLTITLNMSSDLPEYAIGDEKRLVQIILNIVGNAVKFSKEGNISIMAFVAKSESLRDTRSQEFFPIPSDNQFYLRVQVKDSGSGINPTDIPKLFTKFAQTQLPGMRNSSGSGLGLAICKSDGLGKGCTAIFIAKLGIAERDSKLPSLSKVRPNNSRLSFPGLKVVVLDENGSQTVTKGLLTHLGCDVTTVSTGEKCLHVVTQEHKVVFIDVGIPGIDGFDVALRMHEKFTKRNEKPLIVALTGNTDRLTKETCMRVGMDGVVLKPVSVDKMRSILSQLLEHRVLFEA